MMQYEFKGAELQRSALAEFLAMLMLNFQSCRSMAIQNLSQIPA